MHQIWSLLIHLMSKIGEVLLFNVWINFRWPWLQKGLKDFIIVNGKLYHRGHGGLLARVLLLTKEKNNCTRFMIFHREKMISACIDAFRDKNFIGMRWLEMRLRCKWPLYSANNLSTLRGLCLFRRLEIGDSPIWISCCIDLCHLKHKCDQK